MRKANNLLMEIVKKVYGKFMIFKDISPGSISAHYFSFLSFFLLVSVSFPEFGTKIFFITMDQ